MDGFNVLNEIAEHHDMVVWGILAACVACVVLFVGLILLFAKDFDGVLFLFLACLATLMSVGFFLSTQSTRYEITLKPGAVIDATRWDIVSQRGDIYVIQERKPNAD